MSVLQASTFAPVYSNAWTERPVMSQPPPSYSNGMPPTPSVRAKMINPPVIDNAVATLYVVPFTNGGWEQNYAKGMPLFTNSKRTSNTRPECVAASPAVINFLLEDSARKLFMAQTTVRKRKREEYLSSYQISDHLYTTEISDFLKTWNWFGTIDTIDGKLSQSGVSMGGSCSELIVGCNVQKWAKIINYWGNVKDGDRLFWTIGLKKNVNTTFTNPSGQVVGSSSESPSSFLQLIPVSHGTGIPAHNTNYRDLHSPNRKDVDFVRLVVLPQKELHIDTTTGKSTEREIDLATQTIKTDELVTERYEYGGLFYVGTVRTGSRKTCQPSEKDLHDALRNDKKAQTLEMITVFLGH